MPARKAGNKNRTFVLAFGKGILSENPYLRTLTLAALLGVALFLILNFTGVLPFSSFFGLGGGAGKVGVLGSGARLFCPVSKEICRQGKATTFNGRPGLAYKLEPNAEILAVAPAFDSKDFSSDPFEKNAYRGVWQTNLLGQDCYTFTYIFPKEAALRVARASLKGGEALAFAPPSFFKAGQENVSFVLLAQKRTLESSSGAPQTGACTIGTRQPVEFGEYLKVDPSVFK